MSIERNKLPQLRERAFSIKDPLSYLPRKSVQEFGKGRTIYDSQQAAGCIYVVILGRVKVMTTADDGVETVARIVPADGLFGESCLLPGPHPSETAVALESVMLMGWTRDEIERQIEREPELGIALAQYMVRKCVELQDRIESMAIHKTPERVMLAMLQLARGLGAPQADGAARVHALTHFTIAEYVGTSREIVTFQMNRLRRLGLIKYSRKYIDIYCESIQEELRRQPESRADAGPGVHSAGIHSAAD